MIAFILWGALFAVAAIGATRLYLERNHELDDTTDRTRGEHRFMGGQWR